MKERISEVSHVAMCIGLVRGELLDDVRADAAVTELTALLDRVEAMEKMLQECADDIEGYVNIEYRGTLDGDLHPAYQRKFDRDLEIVHRARALTTEES